MGLSRQALRPVGYLRQVHMDQLAAAAGLGRIQHEASAVLNTLLDSDARPTQSLATLVAFAAHHNGTDLYCSAQRDNYMVAIRRERQVMRIGRVPRDWAEHFVGYAKVEAQLKLDDHRHPQDGHISVRDGSGVIDVRVATFPTYFGEDLSLRILDARFRLMELDELGLSAEHRDVTHWLLRQPSGLILIAGHSGSGKTTTAYALLDKLNDGTRKINTLEDPVECYVEGVHQTQVNGSIGLDFADLLPPLLRHDPDVIFVGEIRDPETARIATRAAGTGHLVIATIHAPHAAGAVHSMLNLGANRHTLAGSLRGVIAQDLLRRVCSECAQPVNGQVVSFSLDDADEQLPDPNGPGMLRAVGCEACSMSGYDGLVAVFELLKCSPEVRRAIDRMKPPDAIADVAVQDGMVPLSRMAKVTAVNGITSVEEVSRYLEGLHSSADVEIEHA